MTRRRTNSPRFPQARTGGNSHCTLGCTCCRTADFSTLVRSSEHRSSTPARHRALHGDRIFGARHNGGTVLLPRLNRAGDRRNKAEDLTNTADDIDLSQDTPRWRRTTSMQFSREHTNVVLLADGTVLVVGGRGGDIIPKHAELFDPVTETWTRMAAQVAQRGYHSTAVLLPDGRVLSAGAGDGNRLTGEIYSPPYLFKGGRPTIASVTPSSRRSGIHNLNPRRWQHRPGGLDQARGGLARRERSPALRGSRIHPRQWDGLCHLAG